VAIQIAETQTLVTRNAAIHDVAPNAAIQIVVTPNAAIQIGYPVLIRVVPISAPSAAQTVVVTHSLTAVSLPAPLVHDAPHEESRVAAQ
jgi:hypothetical protein